MVGECVPAWRTGLSLPFGKEMSVSCASHLDGGNLAGGEASRGLRLTPYGLMSRVFSRVESTISDGVAMCALSAAQATCRLTPRR